MRKIVVQCLDKRLAYCRDRAPTMLPATDRCLLLAAKYQSSKIVTNAEEHAQLKENIHISSSVIHSKSICGDMKINPIIGITVSKI